MEQNVAFGLRRLEAGERARRTSAQIAAMHLSGLERRYPAGLSGGEQQRVALARALAPQPAALLLDEPFSALDTHLRSQVERQLHETLAGYKGAALVAGHNLEEIYRLCGELVVLDRGRVIARGPRERSSAVRPIAERPSLPAARIFRAPARRATMSPRRSTGAARCKWRSRSPARWGTWPFARIMLT